MTTRRRGDVVLVPVGFTDQSGVKRRPAVIVSSDRYNAESPDLVIASIASNLAAIAHPGDHAIERWQEAGLLRPSMVQPKLATIEARIASRRLGHLVDADLAALDCGLREALALS